MTDNMTREPEEVANNSALEGARAGDRRASVTLKDVARRANVSPTTASLFFNGRENVCAEATAERLRQAAADLQYSVNRGRRRKSGNTTGSVSRGEASDFAAGTSAVARGEIAASDAAACILGISVPRDAMLSSPAANGVLQACLNASLELVWRGINHVADVEDFRILQYPRRARESLSIEPFLQGSRVKGVIMLARSHDPRPGLLAAAGVPVVVIGRLNEIPEGCGAVFTLESDTVDLALSHLWDLGHRRIAHISSPLITERGPGDEVVKRRLDRFAVWTQIRSIYDPKLVLSCNDLDTLDSDVTRAVGELMALPEPPTALFCGNDAIAIEACRAAAELGIRIPQDLSVLGIDNSVFGAENSPSISSVEIPFVQIGIQAVVQLSRLLEGAPAAACRLAVAVNNLVVRESTGPAPVS